MLPLFPASLLAHNPRVARIWIRGTSGAGKTTLGRAVGARLGVPAVDMDDLHWLPGWQMRSREEFRALLDEKLAGPGWVVMGNYTSSASHLEGLADTIVWLDYPLPVTFGRVLRRTVRRLLRGEACCNGNRESFRMSFFDRESILLWSLTTHRRNHRACLAAIAEARPGRVHLRHRSPRETRAWLEGL